MNGQRRKRFHRTVSFIEGQEEKAIEVLAADVKRLGLKRFFPPTTEGVPILAQVAIGQSGHVFVRAIRQYDQWSGKLIGRLDVIGTK